MKRFALGLSLLAATFIVFVSAPLVLAAPSAGTDYASCMASQYPDPDTTYCADLWGGPGGGSPGAGGSSGGGFNTAALTPYKTSILNIINNVLFPVLFAVAFIVFLYGVAKKYIFSRGDETAVEEGHKLLIWGVIGFVIMVSIWGLVNLVSDTFNLTSNNTLRNLPQTPLNP